MISGIDRFANFKTCMRGSSDYDQLLTHRDEEHDKDLNLNVRSVDTGEYVKGRIVRRKNGAALIDNKIFQNDKREVDLEMLQAAAWYDKDENDADESFRSNVGADQFNYNTTQIPCVERDTMQEHPCMTQPIGKMFGKGIAIQWGNKHDELSDSCFTSQRPD